MNREKNRMNLEENKNTVDSRSESSSGLVAPKPNEIRVRKDVLLGAIAAVIILFAVLAFGKGDSSAPSADFIVSTTLAVADKEMDDIVVLINEKQYSEAILKLQTIVETDPKNAIAYYNLGVAYQFTEKLEEADVNYTRSLEIDGQNPSGYYNRGLVRRDLGRLEEAAADLKIANALKDDWAAAKYNLGQILISLGDSVEGNKQIEAARLIAPNIGK
jgi:tetratricopeptide (TPR) repeat protein